MTPAQALDMHRRMLAKYGEDIIVRRRVNGVVVEAVARGRPVGLRAEQIVGAITASDCNVIVINDPQATVPAGKVALSTLLPLTTLDKLVIDGRELAIKFPDDKKRRIAGVVIALEILAAG